MRKSYLLLYFFISCIILLNTSYAQKSVNEASMNYTISIQSTDDKAAMAQSLEGATFSVYLKGTQSRTDMVSTLGTESNLYDSKTGKGTILKQYSGQKLMITLTSANWQQKNQAYQNMKFSIDNTEQNIGGFKCKKATGQSADGKTFTVYFTTEFVLLNKQYENAFAQLPGIPVQYELQSGKLKFKYSLKNVSYDPVATTKFDIPKTGYRVMTYEENQQLRKGEN